MEVLENDKLELVQDFIPKAMDYARYRKLVSELAKLGKTPGPNQDRVSFHC